MNDMLQSVERAMHVLERIAFAPNEPHRVREIAAQEHLSVQTASKILRTFSTLGYLENTGRKRGYILGPKTARLGEKYRDPDYLRHLAKPYLEEYSRKFGEYINLCCMINRRKRIVLKYRSRNADPVKRLAAPQEEELLQSLSGYFFAATLPEEKQQALYRRSGAPPFVPAEDEEQFLSQLKQVAAQSYLAVQLSPSRYAVVVPILLPTGETVMLGSFMPPEHYTPAMLEMLQQIRAELSRKY